MKAHEFSHGDTPRALLRFAEADRRLLERFVFQRHPEREWGTFFRFGFRRTAWGLALTFVDALAPQPGDLDRGSPIVSFRPDYIRRATDQLERQTLGVGVVHSHPHSMGVSPSPSDDDMDVYFAGLFERYGEGRPYLSLILNRDRDGRFQCSGRAFDRGVWMPVSICFTVGRTLERLSCDQRNAPTDRHADDGASEHPLSRWEMLVGGHVRARFAGASVGIVGCGGTGSAAVEALARARVGSFVLVDHQRLSVSNVERIHGSCASDARAEHPPYKVEIMTKLIRDVNPDARVTAVVGNVLDDVAIDALLGCDLVLGCTDTLHARACLGDLASLYLLPGIDVGVLLRGETGRILNQHIDLMRLSPEDPCPFCRGKVHPIALSAELAPKEERERCRAAAAAALAEGEDGSRYWGGEIPQLPTVGYLTTAAGALCAGYALNWLLGTSEMPHGHFQFDIDSPEFAFASDEAVARTICSCVRYKAFSDQGDRSVSMPRHFERARTL